MAATARLQRQPTFYEYSQKKVHSPDSDGEHIQHVSSLEQANQKDDSDDSKGVEGELSAKLVHRALKWSLGGLEERNLRW